jgi:hypothetical protein
MMDASTDTIAPAADPAGESIIKRPPRAGEVLLITGARSLTSTRDAAWWTWCQIASLLFGTRRPSRIITGDSPGAQALARSLAISARITLNVFRLDGTIGRPEGDGRWHEGEVPDDRYWPLQRSRAMIAEALRAQEAGAPVRALMLDAPWTRSGGTAYAADVARDAGLDMTYRECPLSLGPIARGGEA